MGINEVYYIENVTQFLAAMNLPSFQKHDSFHILQFKDHFDLMPNRISLQSRGYFEITFVTQSGNGKAKLKVEETVFQPLQNTFTFVAPGQNTYVDVKGDISDGNGYMLVFTSDFLDGAFSDFTIIQHFPFFNMHVSPVYNVGNQKGRLFLHLMKTIYMKFQQGGLLHFDMIRAYLKVLLLEIKHLANNYKNETHGRSEEITFLFENMVKQTQYKNQPVKYYAEQLHISPVYLSECVKKVTGLTVKQIVDKYIILETKSLLVFSSMNIGEIGCKLGFDDRSNFINFFKKKMGKTPNAFRNETK